MCGFLVYRVAGDNTRIRLRGQDGTNVVRMGGFTFTHNLLWVTGAYTPQPYLGTNGIACVYNGEIYNHPFSQSDGEVLIPLYEKYGPAFVSRLDGEFAIALYDFKRGIAVFATDPFGTKPLFINGAECGSYRSGVGGTRLKANRCRVVRLATGATVAAFAPHTWDFNNQHVDSYGPWCAAFRAAVAKRATQGCFLGLSAGYDSGAIACALQQLGTPFKAYTFTGAEHRGVLAARHALVDYELFTPSRFVQRRMAYCYGGIDNEPYTIYYKGVETAMRLLDDGGIYGVATYAMLARNAGRKVALSGQGADEIMSDYAPYPDQSELLGRYPAQLAKWRNFDMGCQESYLLKEEYAGGAYNIETRYPFLDRRLVQAFLHLTPAAKNSHYKAPLRAYLKQHDYPFAEGVKTGFGVDMHSLV